MGDVIELPTCVESDVETLRENALCDAAIWSQRIDLAREAYDASVEQCARLGVSKADIAWRVGKTEAAIRMHLKRKAKK